MIYLDWNATAPPAPEVMEAISRAAEHGWANPASVHGAGRMARKHIEGARERVAELLSVDPRDVILTGGGTEANNLALRGVFNEAALAREQRPVLVTSAIEHPSILGTAALLEARGAIIVRLPAPGGRVSVDALGVALDAHGTSVRLVSIQAVNHETGVLQPIEDIKRLCDARGILFHSDAVQYVGRLPERALGGIDLVSIAAHKLRGPKGVGALVTKCGLKLTALFGGGAQERGVRPGTQDPIACAGFEAALRRVPVMRHRFDALSALRETLHHGLRELDGELSCNGEGWPRAPHVLNVSFGSWKGPELCAALDLEGVAVSSGAACSAGTAEPSPVISHAWGRARATSAVRMSLGETTTAEEIQRTLAVFQRVLSRTPSTSRNG